MAPTNLLPVAGHLRPSPSTTLRGRRVRTSAAHSEMCEKAQRLVLLVLAHLHPAVLHVQPELFDLCRHIAPESHGLDSAWRASKCHRRVKKRCQKGHPCWPCASGALSTWCTLAKLMPLSHLLRTLRQIPQRSQCSHPVRVDRRLILAG